MMTGNRDRALATARERPHQPTTSDGFNVVELSELPVARAVAELNQVIEDYKRENRQLRARIAELESGRG